MDKLVDRIICKAQINPYFQILKFVTDKGTFYYQLDGGTFIRVENSDSLNYRKVLGVCFNKGVVTLVIGLLPLELYPNIVVSNNPKDTGWPRWREITYTDTVSYLPFKDFSNLKGY